MVEAVRYISFSCHAVFHVGSSAENAPYQIQKYMAEVVRYISFSCHAVFHVGSSAENAPY